MYRHVSERGTNFTGSAPRGRVDKESGRVTAAPER
jgi:hypothetical protein